MCGVCLGVLRRMASQIEEREAILECHNAVLYPLDLEYFQDGNWLNDNCLYFLYSYYEHSLYNNSSHLDPKASDETSLSASSLTSSRLSLSPPVNPLLFLDPSIVSYIRCQRLDTDDVSDLQKGLKLSSRSHIFLPCNDRSSFTSSSTHWSLLVIDLITLQVFTLDSSAPSNFQTMKVIATIICCDLLKWLTFHPLCRSFSLYL